MSTLTPEMEVLTALSDPINVAPVTKTKTLAEMVFDIQTAQENVTYAQQDVDDAMGKLSTARMALALAVEAAEPLRALLVPPQADKPRRGRPAKRDGNVTVGAAMRLVPIGKKIATNELLAQIVKVTGIEREAARRRMSALLSSETSNWENVDRGFWKRVA